MQLDTELLREGLRGARRQLQALQRQLGRMQREAGRQQVLAETLLMEKECEVRLAKSEAEAYRVAAAARSAAVGSLQKLVGTLQEDKQRVEAYVRQLQHSMKEVLTANSELQQQAGAREEEREALAALGLLLQQKAEQVQQAQRAVAASAGTAVEAAAAVRGLRQQLAEAEGELQRLRSENKELRQQVEGSGTAAASPLAQRLPASGQAAALDVGEVGSGDPGAAAEAAPLQQQLEATRARCAELEAANGQLAQQAQQAGQVAALQAEFEEAARQLVEACDQNAALSERLAEVRVQVDELTALVEAANADKAALGEERAALAAQLQQSRAEVASLARMVRLLKAGPSASGLQVSSSWAIAATPGARLHQGGSPARGSGGGDGAPHAAAASISGSSCSHGQEEEDWDDDSSSEVSSVVPASACGGRRRGAAPAPTRSALVAAAAQQESRRVQLLEEEVGVLMGVVRRLQGQNRQLSAQLAGGGPSSPAASAPSWHPPPPRSPGGPAPRWSPAKSAAHLNGGTGGIKAARDWDQPAVAGVRQPEGTLLAENAALRAQAQHVEAAAQQVQQELQHAQQEAARLRTKLVARQDSAGRHEAPGGLSGGSQQAQHGGSSWREPAAAPAGPWAHQPALSLQSNPLFQGDSCSLPASPNRPSLSQASSVQPRAASSHLNSPAASRHSSLGAQPIATSLRTASATAPPPALRPRAPSPLSEPSRASVAAADPKSAVPRLPGAEGRLPAWLGPAALRDPPTPKSACQPVGPRTAEATLASSDSENDVIQSLRQAIATLDVPGEQPRADWGGGEAHVHGGGGAQQLLCGAASGQAGGGAPGWQAADAVEWAASHDQTYHPAAACNTDQDSDLDLFDSPRFSHGHLLPPALQPPGQQRLPHSWQPSGHEAESLAGGQPDHHQQQQQQGQQGDDLLNGRAGGAGEGVGYEAALRMLQQLQEEIASLGSGSAADGLEAWPLDEGLLSSGRTSRSAAAEGLGLGAAGGGRSGAAGQEREALRAGGAVDAAVVASGTEAVGSHASLLPTPDISCA